MNALQNKARAFRQWAANDFRGDFMGAVASTLVSLPISMSVGVISFAPLGKDYLAEGVLAGVYGAIILGLMSALFGARSIMLTGPRAASALIIASLMAHLLSSDNLLFPPGQTANFVIAITFFAIFLAGAIQFLLGATRAANIVKNIPYPVAAGFMNSAALVVITGQSWALLDIPKQESLLDIFAMLGDARPLTMLPGLVTAAAMIISKRTFSRVPSPVVGLAAGCAVYYAMKMSLGGLDVGMTLGALTSTLPKPHAIDMFSGLAAGGDMVAVLLLVVPAAFSLAAMLSLESALTLSQLDDLSGRQTDSNKELAGHGIGNMAAALCGGLMGSGAMVRSKPGYDAGGRTPAMAIMGSGLMLLIAVPFAGLIEYIPRAVIAGMILVIGFQNFDLWSLKLFKSWFTRFSLKRTDALIDTLIIVLVVSVAMAQDLIIAVGVGIGVAVIVFVSRMSRSVVRRECRGPDVHARSMWNEERQALLETCGHKISVLDLEGAIFFGTASSLESRINGLIREGVSHVVLDMKRVNNIDSTGSLVVQRIARRLKQAGGFLAISYVLEERRARPGAYEGDDRRSNKNSRHIWKVLSESGAGRTLGTDVFFPDTDSALAFCENNLIQRTNRTEKNSSFFNGSRNLPPILHGLDRGDIKKIRRRFTRHVYQPSENIFSQGDDGDALYYIAKGRADVYVQLEGTGQMKRLQAMQSGSVFGEMAILDRQPRAASVVAVEETVCYRLGVEEFEQIKAIDSEIAMKLFGNICSMLSGRIRSANIMITELEK